jgi:hypothetical protein
LPDRHWPFDRLPWTPRAIHGDGAIAAVVLLTSLIHLLAGLSLAVFLYVFHKGQG